MTTPKDLRVINFKAHEMQRLFDDLIECRPMWKMYQLGKPHGLGPKSMREALKRGGFFRVQSAQQHANPPFLVDLDEVNVLPTGGSEVQLKVSGDCPNCGQDMMWFKTMKSTLFNGAVRKKVVLELFPDDECCQCGQHWSIQLNCWSGSSSTPLEDIQAAKRAIRESAGFAEGGVVKKEECPECGGTGYRNGFGPFCSRGCKPTS